MKKSEAIGGFTAAVGFKAVLGEDGQWRCDRPDIERLLNAQFAPKRIVPSGNDTSMALAERQRAKKGRTDS